MRIWSKGNPVGGNGNLYIHYELPHVRGQGWQLGRATPAQGQGWWPEELPHTEARGGSLEERPHIQGAVAVQAPEGLEELFHVQGRKGWW